MGKVKLLLVITILSLLTSCGKEKVETERKGWGVHYDGTPIHITSLLPDLKGQNVTSEGGVYSLVIPFPDHRYSYTPSRIWLEPQDTTFTAQVDDFTSTPPFDDPISVHFHSRGNLSFNGKARSFIPIAERTRPGAPFGSPGLCRCLSRSVQRS